MPSLTECIDNLKKEIEAIAGRPMTQNYDGLGDLFMNSDDTTRAKEIATSLQQSDRATERQNTVPQESSLSRSYAIKSLQSAWNIADTLSIVIRYTPCEWSAGFFRGLMASGPNGELNAHNLLISMFYMNEDSSVVPYIVDDITYEINCAFLKFTKAVQSTSNGKSIISLLKQLSLSVLDKPIILDKQVIQAAEPQIRIYQQYKAQLSSAQKDADYPSPIDKMHNTDKPSFFTQSKSQDGTQLSGEEDDDDIFYDANSGDDEDTDTFYDAAMTEEERIRTEITKPILGFVYDALTQFHAHRENLGDEYPNIIESYFEISDEILDPNATLESITECILENKKIESFLKKEQSKGWLQNIIKAFDYLKEMIDQVLDSFSSKKTSRPS